MNIKIETMEIWKYQLAICTSYPIIHMYTLFTHKTLHNFFGNYSTTRTEIRDKCAYGKFWGANKVHYGRCKNGKYEHKYEIYVY